MFAEMTAPLYRSGARPASLTLSVGWPKRHMSENDRADLRQSSKSRNDPPMFRLRVSRVPMARMRSDSLKGMPRRRTAFTNVKTALFAAIPSARVTTATSVNHRSLTRSRTAKRRSWSRPIVT